MPSPITFRFLGPLMLGLAIVFNAQAHDPGLSAVALQLAPHELHADLSMAMPDVRLLVPNLEADTMGKISQQSLTTAMHQLQSLAADAFEVEWNGRRVPPTGLKIQADD